MKHFIIKSHKLFSLSVLLFLLLTNISTTVLAYDYSFPNKKTALFQNTSSVDLSVELAFCDDYAPTGNTCIEIRVTNHGMSKATDVVVENIITNYTSLDEILFIADNTPSIYPRRSLPHHSDPVLDEYGATVNNSWVVGDLEVNQTKTMKIFLNFDETFIPLLDINDYHLFIEASVSANEDDVDQTNNAAVLGNAYLDLVIEKTASPMLPIIGDKITFTVSVKNNSLVGATNILVKDILPSGYTIDPNDPTSIIASNGEYDVNTGIWKIEKISANSSTETLSIRATVKIPTENISYNNSARIISADQAINSLTSTKYVVCLIDLYDLELDLSASKTTITEKDTVIFTITVNNSGPNIVEEVEISSFVSDGFSVIDSEADHISVNNDQYHPRTYQTWELGDVAPGETMRVDFTTIVNDSTYYLPFFNSSSVFSQYYHQDSNPYNDTASIEFQYITPSPSPTTSTPIPTPMIATSTPTPSEESEIPLLRWGNFGGTGYLLFDLASLPDTTSSDEDVGYTTALLENDPQPCDLVALSDEIPVYLQNMLHSFSDQEKSFLFCDLPFYLNARQWNGALLHNEDPIYQFEFDVEKFTPAQTTEFQSSDGQQAATEVPCPPMLGCPP